MFSCGICKASFQSSNGLTRHNESVHDGIRYKCNICDKKFNQPVHLDNHVRWHLGERPFKCTKCSKSFVTNSKLKINGISHLAEEDRPHKCPICQKGFAEKYRLQKHMNCHNTERPFKCDKCSRSFNCQSNLTVHVKYHHTDIRPHSCGKCSKSFVTISALRLHLPTHSKDRPFKCSICEMTFRYKHALAMHDKIIHKGFNPKPFECIFFNKSITTKTNYFDHYRSHIGERPHTCKLCSKEFRTRSNRIDHNRRIHLNLKTYECNICQSKFYTTYELESHVRHHLQEKTLSCPECKHTFINKQNLKLHFARLHEKMRPFKCDKCTRKFALLVLLHQHQKQSHGPTVQCKLCGNSYSNKAHLKFHIARIHNGIKSHSCLFCDDKLSFFEQKELFDHMRNNHTMEK